MPHIDATPFIDITRHGHRPFIGKEKRVTLTSSTVEPVTLRQLNDWMVALDVSRGILLDQLTAFAVAHGFVKPAKKTAGPATTPQPAAPTYLRTPSTTPAVPSVNRNPKPAIRHVQK